MKWFQKASDQNLAKGHYNLGVYYENGYGVEKNYPEALKWYRKASEQNDADAECSLGYMYENGYGVIQSYEKALDWYIKSAGQFNVNAHRKLGKMSFDLWLKNSIDIIGMRETGASAKQNEILVYSLKWLILAASQGDSTSESIIEMFVDLTKEIQENHHALSEAKYFVGHMYLDGYCVKQNYAEAVKYFRQSADQNNPKAQLQLGYMYKLGEVVLEDYAEAFKWFQKSADQNNADAQFHVGRMYDQGVGVKQNYAEALKWYQKSAEQDHMHAQHRLCMMYFIGLGVEKDHAEALKWKTKCYDNGYQDFVDEHPELFTIQKNLVGSK